MNQLRNVDIQSTSHLLWTWLADREDLLAVVGPGPLNTWDRPVIAFDTYRAGLLELQAANSLNLSMLLEASERSDTLSAPDLAPADLSRRRATMFGRRAWLAFARGDRNLGSDLMRRASSLDRVEEPVD